MKIYKLFAAFLAVFTAMLLTACGGGGGSSGSNPNQPNLSSTAPSALTMAPGSSGQYEILGGVRPYRVNTSNSDVAVASINGSSLQINAGKVGSATVQVVDASGAILGLAVSVGATAELATTAPDTLTLFPGASNQYEILGGVRPYLVSSSNTDVAVGTVTGTTLRIGAGGAGNAVIRVTDAAGAAFSLTVNVSATTLLSTTAPGALTIGVGSASTRSFEVRGGLPPYSIQGSNVHAFQVSSSGSSFTVTGVAIGGGTITIRDAGNTVVTIAVTVDTPALRVSPTSLKIFPGIDAEVMISGGQPPYRVAGGIPAAITATISDDVMRIRASLASELEISVADAAGRMEKVKVEVVAGTGVFNIMPGALVIQEDDTTPINLQVYGAAAGQVCFYTDKPVLLPVSPACAMNPKVINLAASNRCVNGNTNVLLTAVDSIGAVATSTITIVDNGRCSPTPDLTVSATRVTVQRARPDATPPVEATSAQLLVFGGSGQYTVTASNSGLATAKIEGNVVTITGGAVAGTSTVTVYEQGQISPRSVAISVTTN